MVQSWLISTHILDTVNQQQVIVLRRQLTSSYLRRSPSFSNILAASVSIPAQTAQQLLTNHEQHDNQNRKKLLLSKRII
jgi:hypothetical protein